jgi:peptidoglycan/LPS O-acetylase OafA/YrhL
MATQPKLEVINGLRGFAILAVIWHHLFGIYFKPGSAVAFENARSGGFFLSYGWIGVQLFFVLSGFVLYLPYAQGRARLATGADALAFYRRRAERLLPLYYFSTFLCLVLNQTPPTGEKMGEELISIALVLFPFVNHGFLPHLNPPLWSLGVEIWFSVLFPLVVMGLRRLGVVRFLLAAILVGCGSRTLGLVWANLPLTTGLTANIEFFATGMVLARWHVDSRSGPAHPNLLAGIGAVVIGGAIWWKETDLAGAAVLFADLIALGLSLVIGGLLTPRSGILHAVFANRPTQLLGMMCFSLYIWHEPLLRQIFRSDIVPLDGLIRQLPVYLTLLAIIGALSYRYIEFGRIGDWRTLLPLPAGGSVRSDRKPAPAQELCPKLAGDDGKTVAY